MSFAFNAAPFNNNENNSESSTIERKRNAKNKTIKRRQPSSQINILKGKLTGIDSDNDDLANFEPIHPPSSVGVDKTKRDPIEDGPCLGATTSAVEQLTVMEGFKSQCSRGIAVPEKGSYVFSSIIDNIVIVRANSIKILTNVFIIF